MVLLASSDLYPLIKRNCGSDSSVGTNLNTFLPHSLKFEKVFGSLGFLEPLISTEPFKLRFSITHLSLKI